MDIYPVFQELVLSELGSAPEGTICSDTSNLATYELVENLLKLKEKKLFLNVISKDDSLSQNVRSKGNAAYTDLRFQDSLVLYNESIARAPVNSRAMAWALGNRGACLLNMKYIGEALVDLQTALQVVTIDPSYIDKLTRRRELCFNLIIETRSAKDIKKPPPLHDTNEFFECAIKKIVLAENANSGRCLRTLDSVKTGEVLVVEPPYASMPIPSCIYSQCWQCLRGLPGLLACSRCSTAMYCSTECLRKNEIEHELECKTFEALASYDFGKMDLLSLKIFIKAVCEGHDIKKLNENIENENEENRDKTYKSNDIRRIINLVTNKAERTMQDLLQRAFKAYIMVEALDEFSTLFRCQSIAKSTAGAFILNLLQNMPCNAHEVTEMSDDNELLEVGSAAYATLSLLNHSCDPNVVRQSVGTSVVLRAIRPIAAGEELFDNYGYHFAIHTKDERQSSLLGQYYFTCECEACQRNWPLFPDLPAQPNAPSPEVAETLKDFALKLDVEMGLMVKQTPTEGSLEWLCEYLDLLDEQGGRQERTQEYCKCQEAIKHALNYFPSFSRNVSS